MSSSAGKFRRYLRANASTVCVILSLVFFLFSMFVDTSRTSAERVAARVEKKIDRRMHILDRHIVDAVTQEHDQWMNVELPEDMVIYRYVYDTLQSWSNQFPVINDDISSKTMFQRLPNLRTTLTSPLKDVTQNVKYVNIGPKWYLAKAVSGGMACTVIAGIEVQDSQAQNAGTSDNGTNPHLRIPGRFSISVLGDSGGIPVSYRGEPLFKIFSETVTGGSFLSDSLLRWIALLLVTLAFVLFLRQHRRLRNYFVIVALIIVAAVMAYIWGIDAREKYEFFSPTVYADGVFMYSFGAMMILHLCVILIVISTYLVRRPIYRRVRGRRTRTVVAAVLICASILVLAAYIEISLHSLIMNSSIPWELYLWTEISSYTIITYAVYSVLLFCLLLLVQMLLSVVSTEEKKLNAFSRVGLVTFAVVGAIYFTVTSAVLGFRKEQNRVMVLSNRLAVDRDLSLEINLRSMEESIASDPVIATLSHISQSDYVILNRLTESYLNRITQNYDIALTVCPNSDANCFASYEQRLFGGTPIADRSRFVYTYDANGRSGYLGMFVYYSPEKGLSRILIDITDNSSKAGRGYYSLLGKTSSNPWEVNIPAGYSYAKYNSGRLTRYRGDYAYPTVFEPQEAAVLPSGQTSMRVGKYVHFINKIYDDEFIVISRRTHSLMAYLVTFSYLLLIYLLFLLPLLRRHRKEEKTFRRNYYRSRINTLLFTSLFLTLVAMAVLSVTFVYRRNSANMNSMMSEKITSIQTILEAQCRDVPAIENVNNRDLMQLLDDLGMETKSDITLFSTNGKVFVSTTSDIFDKLEIGSRMNESAYYNIRYRNLRYFINREELRGEKYYSLYAPVINGDGDCIAIVSVPYTEQNIDFRNEALFHAATFINVFLILITLTLLFSTTVVNNMFKPLVEMGKKMNTADLQALNYIIYKRDDEVSTLVEAYNRMVHDLYESMKQVTQAERDKAWSEMARQVAHEIKNPLTPIKLELQRLIRLKERNDPSWSEKFDRVSAIVLEHIDILTDTANEFSTFAKLYTEEPVLMDIDKTLKDQMVIFDNKENITMSYMGLPGANVMAPKPQLIRVFVNLITNAIQAIEIAQNEARDAGREVVQGRIVISLRNSVRDGFYDIVVEDNGPGVKEENQAKLFTPNFTTKSAGTGLGLAICRNIVEKCNGTIGYQRSFTLSGACFVVTLPKPTN